MNKPKCFILVGVPGSGKSTLAKDVVEKENATLLSTDEIRKEICKDENDQSKNWLIFKILYKRANTYLSDNENIIIDATNVDAKSRKNIMKQITSDCDFIAIVKDVPIEVCKQRNLKRKRIVPDEIIDKFFNRFKIPTIEEGFSDIIINTD